MRLIVNWAISRTLDGEMTQRIGDRTGQDLGARPRFEMMPSLHRLEPAAMVVAVWAEEVVIAITNLRSTVTRAEQGHENALWVKSQFREFRCVI